MADDGQSLTLQWAFSFSRDVPNGVVNLANGADSRVAYASAHTLVLYDDQSHSQQLLQGHRNPITAVVASPDRQLVITTDKGPDSLLVVWDPIEGEPMRTMQAPHEGGMVGLDLCFGPQGEQLMVTLGAPAEDTGEQSLKLWEVFGGEEPLISCPVPVGDTQHHVTFNQSNTAEVMTNGEQRVYFWGSQLPVADTFKYYSPPLSQKDFKQAIGRFTQSAFIPGTTQAVTGTVDGDVIIWEQQGISAQIGTRATDRQAIKLLRIHHSPVLTVTSWGSYIVTGGGDGNVRFFDPQMRLMAWFEDIQAGGVTSVSFSSVLPEYGGESEEQEFAQFQVPFFVVGTNKSKICMVDSRTFEDPNVDSMSMLLHEGCQGSIKAMICHPAKPEFLITGSNKTIQRWCMHTRQLLSSHQLAYGLATCIATSSDGQQLMIGFESGMLQLVTLDTMEEVIQFRNTFKPVTQVAFSGVGRHMATMDTNQYLALYCYGPVKGTNRWEYIGKYKSHHSEVVDLHFGEGPNGATRLFSVSRDGRIAEYDLERSTLQNGVQLVQLTSVSGMDGAPAVPTSMCFAPPLPYYVAGATNAMLVIADDEYKLSMFDADNKKRNATYLGPTYAGPITRMVMFRSAASKEHHMAYTTADRIVGLIAMPLDGNPEKSMGLIAHPGAIAAMDVSYDGRKMLTAGPDGVVNMWALSTTSLDLAATTAQVAGTKWAELIAEGEGPEAFQEIQNYFLYAQIRAQGEETTAPREVDGMIPVEALPDVLRGLGYYPTKIEVSHMLEDINAQAAAREEPAPTHMTFEQFLAIYANYRPVTGVNKSEIDNAFRVLAGSGDKQLTKEELVQVLLTEGEAMTEDELAECVEVLLGIETNGSAAEALPKVVSAKVFAEEILGFEAEEA